MRLSGYVTTRIICMLGREHPPVRRGSALAVRAVECTLSAEAASVTRPLLLLYAEGEPRGTDSHATTEPCSRFAVCIKMAQCHPGTILAM